MVVGIVAPDGQIDITSHPFERVRSTYLDRQFAVDLGQIAEARTILVAFEGLGQPIPADRLELREKRPGSSDAERGMLMLIAVVCGMILMPLMFDTAFYRVLREPFLVWHGFFVLCIGAQLVFTFGIYLPLFDLTLPMMRLAHVGSFTAMVAAATMFCTSFLEKGMIDAKLRRAMRAMIPCMILAAAVHVAGFGDLGRWPARVFYYTGGIFGLLYLAMFVQALGRGSISARYLAIGLGPLVLLALLRSVTFALPGVPTMEGNLFLIGATLIEALATAIGVTHRFMTIKHQRDEAQTANRTLTEIANRDPLTGVANRRALMERFDALVARGYTACALIDVDRFKTINDDSGHGVGDKVLVACAGALASDDNAAVFRLGGEEFLILLRGPDPLERAERRRRAIPMRIMRDVPHLGRPVTASMGMLEFSALAMDGPVDFGVVYARADELLYRAKESGRNRCESEVIAMLDVERGADIAATA